MKHVAKVLLKTPEGQYLLMQRSAHPRFPNDPDLPGGTLDPGESPIITAVREVKEEAGINLDSKKLTLLYTGNDYSTHGTTYTLYTTELGEQPEITISWEHAGYEWVTLETLIQQSGAAADTYMRMVHETLVKQEIVDQKS